MNAMRFLRAALAVGAVGMLMAGSSIARADGITNEQAQDILNELKAIRQVLEKMQSG